MSIYVCVDVQQVKTVLASLGYKNDVLFVHLIYVWSSIVLFQTTTILRNKCQQSESADGAAFNGSLSQQMEVFTDSLSQQMEVFTDSLSQQMEVFTDSLSHQMEVFTGSLSQQMEVFTGSLSHQMMLPSVAV